MREASATGRPSGNSAFQTRSTLELLTAIRSGDDAALEQLLGRYLTEMNRWASGRLPGWARDVRDTHDLVQETVLEVASKLATFEYRGHGTLRAYLRQAVLNRIRNEIRSARRRPAGGPLDFEPVDCAASPFDTVLGKVAAYQYEAGLAKLEPADRELIVARVESGLTYQEIATKLNRPSADAVRMAVARALVRLAGLMGP